MDTRNHLFEYFAVDVYRITARWCPVGQEDALGEAHLFLLEELTRLDPSLDEDPHAAVWGAVRRFVRAYAERQRVKGQREMLWCVVSPETSYDDLAPGTGAEEMGDATLHNVFDQLRQPGNVETEVVDRVTLQDAVDRLPLRDQTILRLHAVDELQFKEVSDATGRHAAACRKRYERTRKRLSHDLGEVFGST